MKASPDLERLITANAPYWAAEAEVCRTYFNWSKRTAKGDLSWLARQARKEFWDSFSVDSPSLFLSFCKERLADWDKIDRGGPSRHEVQDMVQTIAAEFSHFVAFADAYETIRADAPDSPAITPLMLRDVSSWPENDALGQLRTDHQKQFGKIGMRATRFTEGGYCGLFAEGMKLKGRSKGDDAIAAACALVFDDEFGHMLVGIAGLDEQPMTKAEWDLLEKLSIDQMRSRVHMRNAQFGNPVPEFRLKELLAGRAQPVVFDFEKAGLAA
jgi:hypothetical protein